MRKILFVDDEENILSSYKRTLHNQIDITTLSSAKEALEHLAAVDSETYALIVSDYMMPEMNGLEFLKKANQLSPLSIKVMLTGYADLETSIAAINEGHIFRFLTKPCPPELLIPSLNACLHQYNLVIADKQLLRETLQESLALLSERFAQTSPDENCVETKRLVSVLLDRYHLEDRTEIEIAALLSSIGLTAIPEYLLQKMNEKVELTSEEKELVENHPIFGGQLLHKIPRFGHVADIVSFQNRIHDRNAPEGSRVLHLIQAYRKHLANGLNTDQIMAEIKSEEHIYGPYLLESFENLLLQENAYEVDYLSVNDLRFGMVLVDDLLCNDGNILIKSGARMTNALQLVVTNHYQNHGNCESNIAVRISK